MNNTANNPTADDINRAFFMLDHRIESDPFGAELGGFTRFRLWARCVMKSAETGKGRRFASKMLGEMASFMLDGSGDATGTLETLYHACVVAWGKRVPAEP